MLREQPLVLTSTTLKIPYPAVLCMALAAFSMVFFYILFNAKILHFLPMYLNDQISYIQVARHLLDYGHFINPPNFPGTGTLIYPNLLTIKNTRLYMPGFFIYLAGIYKLFGISAFTSILPNIICYILSSGLIYSLAKKLYTKQVGLLASLFFILFPFNILYSLTAMSEMPLVFLSLSILWIIVSLPQKTKLFAVPFLIMIAYLFRQTEIFLLIPILGYLWDQKNKIWSLILIILITLFFKALVDYWQNQIGLYSPNILEMLIFGHMYYYDAFVKLPNSIFEITKLFLIHLYTNICLFIYTILDIRLDNKIPVASIIQMALLLPLGFISAIYSIKQKKLWYPISCILLTLIMVAICISLYTGHINNVMRISLFTTPFIFIEAARLLGNPANIYMPTFLAFIHRKRNHLIIAYLSITFMATTVAAILIRHQEKISQQNLSFVESVNPDKNLIVVAPEDLFIEYNYHHYPQMTAFLPDNSQTLFLLNQKYPIGTLFIPKKKLGINFTLDDLKIIHLTLYSQKMYKGTDYAIFKREL